MKNKYILIKVKGNYINLFIKKSLNNNIYLMEIKYLAKDIILVKCLKKDYLKLLRISKDYQIKKVSDLGVTLILNKIKDNTLICLSFLLVIVFIFIFSKVIVSIKVIHSNGNLRKIIALELEDNGLKKMSFKKNYQEIQKIKSKITTKYQDKIEWLEIINKGMTYEVRVEERKINIPNENNQKCHIVSKKDAIVKEIIHSSGVVAVETNSYINKGDILITGDITFNDEIKSSVCAKGIVYGEVWYTINIELPLNYEEQEEIGKVWYNFKYNHKKILKSKYPKYIEESKKLFKLFKHDLFLIKEKAIKVTKKTYEEDEAYSKALTKALESIKVKLTGKEEIITQNVLKKSLNDSTISLEVFVAVKEIISTTLNYE